MNTLGREKSHGLDSFEVLDIGMMIDNILESCDISIKSVTKCNEWTDSQ